ncbi:MAG: glycerol-3-phosphate acyltransferase [Candidatus Heimdallarchaeota archaeon]
MEPSIIVGLITLALGSYIYGSICWAIVISYFKLKQDIRLLGDGNPGAYNVGKNLGGKWGVLTMLLDCTKGLIPAIVSTTVNFKEYQNWAIGLAGTMSLLGHCYPIFFGLKGGNGFSTIFGFMVIFNPWMVLEWGIFVFLLTLIFKYIRPMQWITMILIGSLSILIKWRFYWQNFMPLLTPELAMGTIPTMVLIVSLIQLPRFIPYFYGIYKGTEQKMFFFKPLFRKRESVIENE